MLQLSKSLLLTILILLSFFHNWLVIGLAMAILFAGIISGKMQFENYLIFFALLVPIGAAFIVGINNTNYNIFKDVLYLIIPLLFLLAGGALVYFIDLERFLKIIVFSGVCVSFMIIYINYSSFGISALINPFSSRYEIGEGGNPVGNPAPVLAIGILLFQKKFNLYLFKKNRHYLLLLIINVIGVYMFASRTYIIILLCFLSFLIADSITKKRISLFCIILTGIIIAFSLKPGAQSAQSNANDSLTGKMLNSVTEVSVSNYDDEEDINNRYRGYESYMGLKQYKEEKTVGLIFGELGQLIDLKIYIGLGGHDMRYIPIFHNGYIFLLLKTGLFGILIYIVFFIYLERKYWLIYFNKNNDVFIRFLSGLFVGCLSSVIITHYVVYSFFNIEMAVLTIFLGYVYRYSTKLYNLT